MQKEINVILGERVQACRKEKGFTREAFAERISVSPRFLADVERGNVGVSISTLKTIALELNESVDYLVGIVSVRKEEVYRDKLISKINLIDSTYLKDIDTVLDSLINIAKNENPVIK